MVWLADLLRNAVRLLSNLLARLPGRRVDYVVVELVGAYPERAHPRPPLLRRFLRLPWQQQPGESLEALRARLDRIAGVPTVRGIVLRMLDPRTGGRALATAQSLRQALAEFRGRGKRIIAYLPDAHLVDYYVATAADEIWMPEAGTWRVTGLRTEVTFYREALDRIGVLPEFDRVAEYKTAVDPVMLSAMSAAHRESLESMLESLLAEVINDVSAARRLDPASVRAAIDGAPMSAEEARAAGLINGCCYEDELPAKLGAAERPASLVPWAQARRRVSQPYGWRASTPVIGVVELIGGIIPGESRDGPVPVPFLGGRFAGSDTIARAFRAAERNPRIRAVVFYVQSSGGSALASDLIWREVQRVKAKKPVVAFMGSVAGSGGYYVACGASRIVAQPVTITGSIGVINGKMTARGLYGRLGLNREIVALGDAATMESMFQPYSATQLERVRGETRLIYQRFVAKVAAGRGKTDADVEAIGRGRIWTGRQALDRGLVDELGDFGVAVRLAKTLAGIPSGQEVAAVTIRPSLAAAVPAAAAVPGGAAVTAVAGAVAEVVDALRVAHTLAAEPALLIMSDLGDAAVP